MTKTCTKCGVEKPKLEFGKTPYSKDGFGATCKACVSKAVKETKASKPQKPKAEAPVRKTYKPLLSDYELALLRRIEKVKPSDIGRLESKKPVRREERHDTPEIRKQIKEIEKLIAQRSRS